MKKLLFSLIFLFSHYCNATQAEKPKKNYDDFLDSFENTSYKPKKQNEVDASQPYIFKTFTLESFSKIAELFDPFILNDLWQECPPALKDDISIIKFHDSRSDICENFLHKSINRIMLVGPPGSGKSSLAVAIAYWTQRPYYFIPAASLINEFKNSAISIIDNLFDPLIYTTVPIIIIFDEITSFTNRINITNQPDPGAVEHLWMKMDACQKNPNVLIIFTTNTTDGIPAQIKDRMAGSEYSIPLPNKKSRLAILHHYLSKNSLVDFDLLEKIAEQSDDFSLRELNMTIGRSKNSAVLRGLRNSNTLDAKLKNEDILNAFGAILTAHEKQKNEKNIKRYKEVAFAAAPYILPALNLALYIYCIYRNEKLSNPQPTSTHV